MSQHTNLKKAFKIARKAMALGRGEQREYLRQGLEDYQLDSVNG